MSTTALFLFSDHKVQACTCGRILGGSYVELPDEPRGAARRRMHELRGALWSHEVNGPMREVFGYVEDLELIRRTHQRLPAHAPEEGPCFCGGLGQPYRFALDRGAV